MSGPACDAFRARLAAVADVGALADDPHAARCAACAALARATSANDDTLDAALATLEDDAHAVADRRLAERVAARLEPRRDLADLDPWLDALDDVDVPEGFARAMVERVARARRAPRRTWPRAKRWFALAAAAGLAVGATQLWRALRPAPHDAHVAEAALVDAPSDALLAALDLLEEWDLVTGADGDPVLAAGALEELDLWLLELGAEPDDPPPPDRGTAQPERG